MISYANGGLSGELSNKRPLENGYLVPKYKPRKISAIRDFPPMCGRNVVPVDLKPEENCGSGSASVLEVNFVETLEMTNSVVADGVETLEMTNSVVADGVGTSEMTGVMKVDPVGNYDLTNVLDANKVNIAETVKLSGTPAFVIEDVVGTSGNQNANVEVECQLYDAVHKTASDSDIPGTLDALVAKVTETVNGVEQLRFEIGPLGTPFSNEAESLAHEAVNNPIEVEKTESLEALVGDVMTIPMDGLVCIGTTNGMKSDFSREATVAEGLSASKEVNEVEGLTLVHSSGVEEAKPMQNAGASVDQLPLMGNSQSLPSFCGSIGPKAPIRLKIKYRRRRVSAVRDFPPFCGRNVPLPTEEEKQMAISGNDCLDTSGKVEVETEALRNCSDRGTPIEMLLTSENECLDAPVKVSVEMETETETSNASAMGGPLEDIVGAVGVDIVNLSPDKNVEVRPSHGGFSSGNELRREVVHGLMAEPYCPWRKAKAALYDSDGRKSGRKVASGKQKFNAVALNSDIEMDGLEGSSAKNTAFPDSYDTDGSTPSLSFIDKENYGAYDESLPFTTPVLDNRDEDSVRGVGKDIIVHGLMAEPFCPWRKAKVALNSSGGRKSRHKVTTGKQKLKSVALNSALEVDDSEGSLMKNKAFPDSSDTDGSTRSLSFMDREDCGAYDERLPLTTDVLDNNDKDSVRDMRKEMIVYSPDESYSVEPLQSFFSSQDEVDVDIVHGLMAAPYCPWRKGKVGNEDGEMSGENKRKQNASWRKNVKAVAKKSIPTPKVKSSISGVKSKVKSSLSRVKSKKQKKGRVSSDAAAISGALVVADVDDYSHEEDVMLNSFMNSETHDIEISLPPFGPNNSGNVDARQKVRETLRLFHGICRKLLHQEEARDSKLTKRIDLLTAEIIKNKGKLVNNSQQYIGQVPGVEVGDEFQYRVELAVVGIHRLYQAGIDWVKVENGVPIATSIVSSGAYDDDVENADVLMYSGQGGNIVGKCKVPQDQKLEKGNLALHNSISTKNPVRVVRGWKESKVVDHFHSKPKLITTYVYDGLYTVTDCKTVTSSHGKLVFMFELRRNPGQPQLAWKELKKSRKNKVRPGVCVSDISEGKERNPICAVNTIDAEKPPPFTYVPKMMYPDWHHPVPPTGCDCTGRCSDSTKCKCAVKNGGEIPYNHNGSLVETKTLVYECGPHCKCPPSCYNRVSQRGIRFTLEIFKTESRGWGVRPLTSIPSGSFICEYAGELLEDTEAEKKIGSDEYLFDIGHNFNDSSMNPEEQSLATQLKEEGGGYTIDAAVFGNLGRFVNHSCSPNLYAQNVIYDHDDKKMPHVMLFAMENIPPLKELTYDYNYGVDQIRDSDGNIKVKKCYCGSADCSGRLY